jgi:hypothetical protein
MALARRVNGSVIPGRLEEENAESRESQVHKGARSSMLRIAPNDSDALTGTAHGLIAARMINAATILFARRRRRSFAVWAVDRV